MTDAGPEVHRVARSEVERFEPVLMLTDLETRHAGLDGDRLFLALVILKAQGMAGRDMDRLATELAFDQSEDLFVAPRLLDPPYRGNPVMSPHTVHSDRALSRLSTWRAA